MLKGEDNPKAVFSNEEVYEIRKIKASMQYTKEEVFDMYKDRISESGFHKIWNYNSYIDIAPEFNTPEIIYFYRHNRPIGLRNKCSKFTLEEINSIRELYYVEAIKTKDIADLYNVNPSTIDRIVSGKTYSEIAIPEPSIKFKRKFHKYTKEEISFLMTDFINSELSITDYLKDIKQDPYNIFGSYSNSAFRNFIIKELNKLGLKYICNNKWNFQIVPIDK